MKITDLRAKSIADLTSDLATARKALAESYRLRAMNELTNTATIRRGRRDIAQLLTAVNEKAAEASETIAESKGKEA